MALHTTPTIDKYTVKEVLNKVINTDADALKVDIDNVTLKTEGSDINIEVHTDKAEDSMMIWTHTVKTGTGGTSYVPLVDGDGHLQVDVLTTPADDSLYAEDSQHTSTDKGNFVLGVRNDTLAALGGTDGDYSPLQVNASGALFVDVANGGQLDTIIDTLETTLTAIETDQAAIEVLLTAANVDHAANEVLLTGIDADTDAIKTDMAAIEVLITSTNSKIDTFDAVLDNILTKNTEIDAVLDTIKVDTEEIEGAVETIETAIKAEDAAHSSGDTGIMSLAVRNDDIAALSGADGDYSPMQVNAAGSLYTVDETGAAGSILVTGTSAVAATISGTCFVAIQFIEDTIFDSTDGLVATDATLYPDDAGTGAGISSGGGGAASDGVTFPQGMTIFGRWSGFKLTATGSVIAYIGYI